MKRSVVACVCFAGTLCVSTTIHADCWRLPNGQTLVTNSGSTPPISGAQRIQCPSQQQEQQRQQQLQQQQAQQRAQQEQQRQQQEAQRRIEAEQRLRQQQEAQRKAEQEQRNSKAQNPITGPSSGSAAPNAQPKAPQKLISKIDDEVVTHNPLTLFAHYISKSGTPARTSLQEISIPTPNWRQIPQLREVLNESCTKAVKHIDTRFPSGTSGLDKLGIGTFTLRLVGDHSSNGSTWAFRGYLKAFQDTYDFNPSTNRSVAAEVSTRVGGLFPGRSFQIKIEGQRGVTLTGRCLPPNLA